MSSEIRILIIEDDPIDQKHIKRVLNKSSLLVDTHMTDNACDAINALESQYFDCCFLDYLLPDRNGIELVSQIREKGIKVPIVIVTAHTEKTDDLPDRAIASGATNYITKSLLTPEGISLIIRNSINMRKVENQLEEAKEEALKLAHVKQDFLANMSHEIRTPLNAIIGFSDLLQKTLLDAEQSNYLDAISISSKNLLVLINDILDVSKLEKGKLSLEEKAFSIKKLVKDVITLNSQAAKIKGLKLVSSLDNDIPTAVCGDSTRITQIMVNLISNAIKFTKEGVIKIEVLVNKIDQNEATISFSVKDTGIGIPKDKLANIFERFTQAESSTTREYGGTGLGLNIVKMLVDLHNGSLNIKSEPKLGTEFSFEIKFPIVSDSELETEGKGASKSSLRLKGMKILIVEDNQLNQMLAESYILRNNGTVDMADNGLIAIDILKEKSYDCIMMDLQMPKRDGFQTTKIIREELNLSLPIIACSAHFQEEEKIKAEAVGMNDYITKPYTEQLMLEIIHKNISNLNKEKTEDQKDEITGFEHNDDIQNILTTLEKKQGKEFVLKLLAIYKKGITETIQDINEGIEKEDFEKIRSKAHFITGSLSILNLSFGHNLASQVEQFIVDKQTEEAKVLALQLVKYLENSLKEIAVMDY